MLSLSDVTYITSFELYLLAKTRFSFVAQFFITIKDIIVHVDIFQRMG